MEDRDAARAAWVTVDAPGDAACWAHRVCLQCGRLNQAEHPEACEACGEPFPDVDE